MGDGSKEFHSRFSDMLVSTRYQYGWVIFVKYKMDEDRISMQKCIEQLDL